MSFRGHWKGLSCLKRKFPEQFSGEGTVVTPPPYPTVRKGLVQDTISTILIGLNTHSTSLAAYSIN